MNQTIIKRDRNKASQMDVALDVGSEDDDEVIEAVFGGGSWSGDNAMNESSSINR